MRLTVRSREGQACERCGKTMTVRKTTIEQPYRYDEMSGLDDIYLVGIEVHECKRCDVREPVIPRIAQLHEIIAKDLIFKKKLLSGKEIRFLRKNAGIAANQFALLIQVDQAYLSRVENGKIQNLGAGADKLARAVAMAAADGKEVRKFLLQLAERRMDPQLTLFSLKDDHWEKLAA